MSIALRIKWQSPIRCDAIRFGPNWIEILDVMLADQNESTLDAITFANAS